MAETTTMQEKVFVNPDHSSQVLYQLSELWRDKKLCDATIEVGPVKVYVHRLVLLAACPYLLTIGGQHDVPVLEVKLPMSVGLEGLNIFLTYLYDGVLNLTTSNLLSVEKLSKILKVTGIKKFCQEFRQMDQSVRETVGPCEHFVSDYSIKMTDNTMKIIFNEVSGMLGELKREAGEQDTETIETKRKKMNIDSLSSALQQQFSNNATSSRVQKSSEGSRERIPKITISRAKESFSSNTSKVVEESDTEASLVHIKQEPTSYSDYEDDNTESYDESSRDQTQTDFVLQAPYSTQAFPEHESGLLPSDHHHKPVVNMEGEGSNVNASQMLQKIVKSMPEVALGLGTAAEVGEDNQPQSTQCEVCGKLLSSKYTTRRRMVTHSHTGNYLCEHCGQSFQTKDHMNGHMAAEHDKVLNNLSCHKCGKTFHFRSNMKYHVDKKVCDRKSQGNEHLNPVYPCKKCMKQFSTKKYLRQHMLTPQDKRLVCETCVKSFRWRSCLTKHYKLCNF